MGFADRFNPKKQAEMQAKMQMEAQEMHKEANRVAMANNEKISENTKAVKELLENNKSLVESNKELVSTLNETRVAMIEVVKILINDLNPEQPTQLKQQEQPTQAEADGQEE